MPENNPSPSGDKKWFYHENDQAIGPHSIQDLRKLEEFGKISPATWIGEAGATEWKPLSSVLSSESQVSSPPPPIPSVSSPSSPSAAKPDVSDAKKGCIGCLALVICGLFIAALLGTCSDDEPRRLTEKELKDPKAAAEKLLKDEFDSLLIEPGVTAITFGNDKGKIWIRSRFKAGSIGLAKERMRDSMKHLFESGLPLLQVTMVAHLSVVDKYGKESVEPIYEVRLKAEEAAKIHWENVHGDQMDDIWETIYLHPSFR